MFEVRGEGGLSDAAQATLKATKHANTLPHTYFVLLNTIKINTNIQDQKNGSRYKVHTIILEITIIQFQFPYTTLKSK